MNRVFKKKIGFFLFLFLVITLLLSSLVTTKNNIRGRVTQEEIKRFADKVLEDCKNESFTPDCYDREIPKLMSKVSMEDAFAITKVVQESDEKYLFCHVLAHKLSFVETSKNKSSWKDVLTRCPMTMCNNGCPHGALMSRFTNETLDDEQIQEIVPDLKTVCEPREGWNPTEVERSMCYHAIGHLNMFITGARTQKALDLCRSIGTKSDGRDYYQTCVQGVFMTFYQPLEPEDFALVKDLAPTKDKVLDFCDEFKKEKIDFFACVTESWPLFIDEINKPEGLVKFCSFTSDEWGRSWCFSTGFTVLTTSLIASGSLQDLADYCSNMPYDYKEQCFANMASRLVQIDPRYAKKAIDLCRLAEKEGVEKHCFSDLLFYSEYSFVDGSEERKDYCLLFDNAEKDKCLSGEVPKDFYDNL